MNAIKRITGSNAIKTYHVLHNKTPEHCCTHHVSRRSVIRLMMMNSPFVCLQRLRSSNTYCIRTTNSGSRIPCIMKTPSSNMRKTRKPRSLGLCSTTYNAPDKRSLCTLMSSPPRNECVAMCRLLQTKTPTQQPIVATVSELQHPAVPCYSQPMLPETRKLLLISLAHPPPRGAAFESFRKL